ncbi:hypothetical protein C7401_13713 [Paraburkholderia unamae]|uniref:hypothetical protein n=1 Tax=Paraburkholderia unamae TaxID=219649 RepID=UPI000DC5C737|nr:hypothetical protein [Paraburkholderia unamae]RAR51473.1 hypothetical protein C7401_13713 [Paraburkholderia unamae]
MGRGMHRQSLEIIETAIEILETIKPTTVRSVCYQLFTRGLITDMSKNETAKVSRLLTVARERGEIPWDWIVDETREVERVPQWSDGTSFIDCALRQYRKDYWQDQPYHIEVISEKGTVRGVIAAVLKEFGVPFRVMHGFASATVANDMAESIKTRQKNTVLLYIGDYDPSGLYMSEVDLPERLDRYGALDYDLHRIALTQADIEDGDLPNFDAATKHGDTRHAWFTQHYGWKCWELDAMNPNDLRERVTGAISAYIDAAAWSHMVDIERAERESMQTVMGEWTRVMTGQG